jgi:hypothetical protein
MSINLTTVHVLHCVFCIVGVREFHVAEAATVLRVESIGGKFDVLDFSIAAEDLDNVLLGDIACKATDMDARRTWCR